MEADSITLESNVTKIQTHDLITWTFENTCIGLIDKTPRNTSDGPDGRFRDKLKLDYQTGSLTITNTRTTDSGVYKGFIKGTKQTTYNYNVAVLLLVCLFLSSAETLHTVLHHHHHHVHWCVHQW
ncbi:hypothetical protein PO909_028391 [Leuciscus waleckii]